MEEEQHERRSHKHKRKSSRRMEEDLNRSSFRTSGDSAGRPPPDKVPRTSGADPCAPPRGNEPYFQREASAQPHSGYESSHGAIPVIVTSQVPPQEGFAASVASVPAKGQSGDGSIAGERGADPEGFEHGADYGGHVATHFNSSLVNDDEAASRAEYRYQHVQGHASRTSAYGDPYGCPRPSARSSSLRTSFDSREGESQSLRVFGRIEDVLARMEHHLAASTSAQASSSAPASTPSSSGEFHSFIFISELLIFTCILWNFISTFFTSIKSLPALLFRSVRHVTGQITRPVSVHPDPAVLNRIWLVPCKMGNVNLPYIFADFTFGGIALYAYTKGSHTVAGPRGFGLFSMLSGCLYFEFSFTRVGIWTLERCLIFLEVFPCFCGKFAFVN
jgi:hypothetical protein